MLKKLSCLFSLLLLPLGAQGEMPVKIYSLEELEQKATSLNKFVILSDMGFVDDDINRLIERMSPDEFLVQLKLAPDIAIECESTTGIEHRYAILVDRESLIKNFSKYLPKKLGEYMHGGYCPCQFLYHTLEDAIKQAQKIGKKIAIISTTDTPDSVDTFNMNHETGEFVAGEEKNGKLLYHTVRLED